MRAGGYSIFGKPLKVTIQFAPARLVLNNTQVNVSDDTAETLSKTLIANKITRESLLVG